MGVKLTEGNGQCRACSMIVVLMVRIALRTYTVPLLLPSLLSYPGTCTTTGTETLHFIIGDLNVKGNVNFPPVSVLASATIFLLQAHSCSWFSMNISNSKDSLVISPIGADKLRFSAFCVLFCK